MTTVPVDQAADLLQAMIEHAMAEHAAIAPRGFDSQRKRANLHADIDALLDHWLDLKAKAA